jgi:hypothetical protein
MDVDVPHFVQKRLGRKAADLEQLSNQLLEIELRILLCFRRPMMFRDSHHLAGA